ncbi:MAG: Hsp20/alpha crystallin family protein [Deltaproteobacteria bacterium]|nr:Hsp20/alpha crystallin family protein [Deltaproteobacteria bacterium]
MATSEALKAKEAKPAAPVRALAPMSAWEREMDRLFDDFRHFAWPRFFKPERWLAPKEDFVRPPAIEISDEKDHVVVKAELPGMSKDDIEVNLTDSTLTIKGEKKREKEVKEENRYWSEREYGSIFRSIDLPAEVKLDDVKATFKDGVLEIRLAKTEHAKRKAVKVQVQ